jgi:hypothetical protein
MKQLTTLLITIATILALIFSGCDKNTFTPGEDNEAHPIVWQYKYDQHQIHSDVIPAMDEYGNIFFSIQNGENVQDVYVFANDKDGNALWDKHYSNSSNVTISRVMYIDNKVIYTVVIYDPLGYYQETIYCLNASNGNINWEYSPDFKNERLIEAMAVTSNYLVVAAEWGGDYPAIDELHYFNTSSGSLFKSIDFGDDVVENISIVGNDIYLGIVGETIFATNDYSAPKIVKIDLESSNILWSFIPEYEDETNYIFENRSIAVDEKGNTFCVIRKQNGVAPSYIYVVNDNGTLANTVVTPEKNSGSIFNILIDKNNNFYTATHNYVKYSTDGGQIWEFYSGTDVTNSNFITGCILGDNDIVYHAEYGGILNVNTVGEIAWAKYDDTQFTNPGYPLLTDDGNMVVVGDMYVSCIKGDGAKIQDAPWPRLYQNNGNTSSR